MSYSWKKELADSGEVGFIIDPKHKGRFLLARNKRPDFWRIFNAGSLPHATATEGAG